ncbi:hypothetical protein L1787_12940 [Acuticoccus sp. M5D2P5]|uniref:hypothetical protein n=1 Tax=Acuticoccus kalidii TaxID=2910977 RepID=UPI001F30BC19|nr:hypothetical protein [Acuticoccus kalidii]MCF3934315.1 hypothetical protein [Acuticoccus kalidii]
MSDNDNPETPGALGASSAVPLVFIDEVISAGHYNGIVHVTMGQLSFTVSGDMLKNSLHPVVSLRMNLQAAKGLRDTLDKSILLAEPPADGGQKN